MEVMNISGETQVNVLNIIAGILHLGNIAFSEVDNYAVPEDDGCMWVGHMGDVTFKLDNTFVVFSSAVPSISYGGGGRESEGQADWTCCGE